MAVPRTSLRAFLTQAKTKLKTAITKREPITFVIGNESADLDSITSPILYAYLNSLAPKKHESASFVVPITNIPKADVALRPELIALLPFANIEADHLITLDDLPEFSRIKSELTPESTTWILVDHNALQGTLGEVYAGRVRGVIDHHEDEGKVPTDIGNEPRIITTSGSCTSLVIEYIRKGWDSLALNTLSSGAAHGQGDSLVDDGAVALLWDAQVAQLALASILIDTMNLTDENKTTSHDRETVDYLEAKIDVCPQVSKGFDRETFFTTIDEAKKDLDSLAVKDILRKDYKQWSENGMTLGMSSVVKPMSFLQGKLTTGQAETASFGGLIDELNGFMEERSLTLSAVMTAFTDGDGAFERELLVLGRGEQGKAVTERFVKSSGSDLDLDEIAREERDGFLYQVWHQGNVSQSRKQVAPMLRKAMSS